MGHDSFEEVIRSDNTASATVTYRDISFGVSASGGDPSKGSLEEDLVKPLIVLSLLLALASAACGGRTNEDSPADGACPQCNGPPDGGTPLDDGAALDAPWMDDRWADPSCGQVSLVPAGNALVGAWDFVTVNQAFAPHTACSVVDLGNKKLSVHQFSLMSLPATNLCYSECVKRGACTAPVHDINDPDPRPWDDQTRGGEPVYVDHTQSETLCAWLGGRLPTLAELVRAAQGDGHVPGVAAMTAAAIMCAQSPSPGSQICGQIKQMDFFNGTNPRLYDVGQIAMDTGPFGQRDLFGSVVEWTGTQFDQAKFCALADGAPDFETFPQQPMAGGPQHVALGFATQVQATIRDSSPYVGVPMAADGTVAYYLGFRCAF